MKQEKKFMIWSNWNLDIDNEEWKDYFNEMEDDYGEMSEDEKWKLMYEINDEYLEDERENLNINLGEEIVVIGSLGFWDGRRRGYKLISSGNVKDCLYDENCDYVEWYCDRYNFRFSGAHHDGSNYYLYRVLRPELSYEQRDNFLWKLTHERVSDRTIRRYTKSIRPYIAKVYGWK